MRRCETVIQPVSRLTQKLVFQYLQRNLIFAKVVKELQS